ncbi:hypothetical protein FRC12_008074 [Ceratobasidium sp. 428]|nr:hypothetical protein FRC12_008074 [Ceratobasidium sp. 428]
MPPVTRHKYKSRALATKSKTTSPTSKSVTEPAAPSVPIEPEEIIVHGSDSAPSRLSTPATVVDGDESQPVAQQKNDTEAPNNNNSPQHNPSGDAPNPEQAADGNESQPVAQQKNDVAETPNNNNSPQPNPSGGATNPEHDEPMDANENILQEVPQLVPNPPAHASVGNAVRQALYRDAAARASASRNPLLAWLDTGDELIDEVISDLYASSGSLWFGDPDKIDRNCKWVTCRQPYMSTLQWRSDAPDKPEDCDGEAVIALIGMAIPDHNYWNPDAGFDPTWGEEKYSKQKRWFFLVYPGPESNIPLQVWDRQVDGSKLVVERAHRLITIDIANLGHCFLNQELGMFRIRSPLFLPAPVAEHYEQAGCLPPELEEDVPENFRHSTWNYKSPDVRTAFENTIRLGYEPQVLPAFNRQNKLIHPNHVPAMLNGAVVVVYCTLERALFANKGKDNTPPSWHVYANLVKVQVLKTAIPVKATAKSKRKVTYGYDPDRSSASKGSSSKTCRTVRVPALVN